MYASTISSSIWDKMFDIIWPFKVQFQVKQMNIFYFTFILENLWIRENQN